MERQTVSVVIPTYNVEHLIRDCLESVKWADEIIVVDMFSTDRTVEICREYPNCRVLQRKDYIFGNVNFGFDQATTDWVIRLDSDERIGPELRDSILQVLANGDPRINTYCFRGRWHLFGHVIEHGPHLNTWRKHMFRRGTARYKVQYEHEDIEALPEYGYLEGYYDHYNYETISQWMQKTDYYTERDMERIIADPARHQELQPGRPWQVLWQIAKEFVRLYWRERGYKDGLAGFYLCGLKVCYQFIWRAKMWEAWEKVHERQGKQ